MDFTIFFLGYVGLFSVVAVVLMFSGSSAFLTRLLTKVEAFVTKVVSLIVPRIVIQSTLRLVHYVFNTRNHVLQIVFGLLVMGGYIIFMLDIVPLLYIFEPDQNHLLIPMVLLFSNAAAFHISCASDPGWITPSNVLSFASLYKADGVIFKDGVECATCRLVKPPRSKHCRICKRCVHRFDHHCIWTNNCVGGGNIRYFVAFLLTLMIIFVYGAVVSTHAMMLLVHHFRMWDSVYLDPQSGQAQPMTLPLLIQQLFMQQPRSIFLITSLCMLTLLVGLFTLYHLYLIAINQTTNERNKLAQHLASQSNGNSNKSEIAASASDYGGQVSSADDLSNQQPHQQDSGKVADLKSRNGRKKFLQKQFSNNNSTKYSNEYINKNHSECFVDRNTIATADFSSFFDKGLFGNLKEVLLPWSDLSNVK